MQQHQRREVQDWLNLFEQQKQSGLTAVEFCRQQQIDVQTYYYRTSTVLTEPFKLIVALYTTLGVVIFGCSEQVASLFK